MDKREEARIAGLSLATVNVLCLLLAASMNSMPLSENVSGPVHSRAKLASQGNN